MTTILLEENLRSIEFKGILEKGKRMKVQIQFLIVKIHKDSSVLESRIENTIPKNYNQYLVQIIQRVKFCKVL